MNTHEAITFLPIVVASLVGSPHCAAMCGGFVAIYSRNAAGNSTRAKILPHLLYSVGRSVTYLTLGVGVSYIGAGIDSFSGIARAAAILVGV